jgi:iron complex outermembrane receptor protein
MNVIHEIFMNHWRHSTPVRHPKMNLRSLPGGRALAAGLALLFPAAADAQVTSDSTRRDSARVLAPVTVTGTHAAGVTGGAAAVLVRNESLRSSPAPSLDQALRESPFVHVRQNSRGEMELSVRGSDSRQAAVLLDGIPLTIGWDHRTDPSLIPMTGTDRIVFVRGLGSLLNGPNTLGGTIEISHAAGVRPEDSGRFVVGAGVDENAAFVLSAGTGLRLGAPLGAPLSIQLGLAHRDREGVNLPRGASDPSAREGLRTGTDLRQTDGYAVVRWSGRLGRSLGVMLSGFNAERGVPPEEHVSDPRLWRYPYHSRAIAGLSANSGLFSTPFGFGTIEGGIGLNSGRLKIETYDDRQYRTVTGEELGNERTMSWRWLATHSLPASATLKLGLSGGDVRYTETLSPAAGVDYRQVLMSGGAEVEVPFGATTVSGGAVLDRTSTPESGGREPAQEPFDAVGWRAGVSRDLNREWRLHASLSRRSRFPALRELYSGALNRFTPNPDLKPETLLGFETGVTVSRSLGFVDNGTFELTGFRHNLDDAVVRITLAGPTRFMRVNRDRIETTGAELLAGLVFGPSRERAVTLTGDALVQQIRIFDVTAAGSPARHAENNPERRGSLELGLPLPASSRAYATGRYTGRQYCLNGDSGNEDVIAGEAEMDVGLERRFALAGRRPRSLRALVAMDNVTDARVFDQCGLVQPGRTLRAMFTIR